MHDCWVSHVLSYQSTLKLLFQEFNDSDPEAQLSSITTRIMQAVQYNLDGKSKQYKDPGLTQLFLMNNIHYIVRSVRRSQRTLWEMTGFRYTQQDANQCKRVSWAKILQCLSVQCSTSSGGGIPVGVR
ncbi:hypothetical protein F2P56_005881 [Juglans regia]|uniref:Exocyst subunit Exo70 family protein n=1 Tax=Juglans regia TaxID=51240 RepID=A0A834CXQ9_JUGRE|nr:hypothetical protein F2P56_005881 [Juglans regia]